MLANLAPIKREVRSREKRWYDVRLRPYRTIDDKIDGVVITFIDITERRQVEEALRESEQRFRQVQGLLELSGDPIFIWDSTPAFVEWNYGSEELYGYSRQQALGRNEEELLRTSLQGRLTRCEGPGEHSSRHEWNGELRQRTKAGAEVIVESPSCWKTMGGRRLALESSHDVTERKQWDKRQNILLGELSHRVKNTLAVVQAIAHQSLRRRYGRRTSPALQRPPRGVARAHDLLVQSHWKAPTSPPWRKASSIPIPRTIPNACRLKAGP